VAASGLRPCTLVAAMLTLLALVGIVVGPTATADVIVVVVVVRTLVVPPIRLCHEQGGMSGEGLRRKGVEGRPRRRVRGRAGRKQEGSGRMATGMRHCSGVAPWNSSSESSSSSMLLSDAGLEHGATPHRRVRHPTVVASGGRMDTKVTPNPPAVSERAAPPHPSGKR